MEIIKSIRLLKKKEIKMLFPGAIIKDEKLMGITISFLVYNKREWEGFMRI
mgnify:CR=1 FL=1